MELLKKGIIIGLGAHDMSKKQIEDFTKKLHESRLVNKDQARELVETIMKRKSEVNDHLNSRIENFLKVALQKEQLATLNHIEYLEKRIDLLEEELYNLLLEKYIDDVDDDEIAKLLKELKLDEDLLEKPSKGKKEPLFDEDWLKSDDAMFDNMVDLDDKTREELEDLLCLPKEGGFKMAAKKKVKKAAPKKAVKKAAPKKKATKKKAKK